MQSSAPRSNPSTISISVKSTGFQFLSTFLSDDNKISIDISNTIPYESNGAFVYAFSLRDNKETIKNQVPFLKQKESQILNDTARLILTKLTQKKVRVALGKIDFLFEPQFGLYGSPKLYPDSVEIYGSEKELSNIVEVKTKTKKYNVILKTNKNKAIKNTKVYLKVNGKTYVAKTNSKGKATFKITKLTKKGKFTAVVTYKGSAYYNKTTKKVKITTR